jgi:hypothetical protein
MPGEIESIALDAMNRIGIMAHGAKAYTSDFTYDTQTILNGAFEKIDKIKALEALDKKRGYQMDHEPMLQYFTYEHLKEPLAAASKPFCELAQQLVATLPRNPERTVALRKLLEAKDAGVRAVFYKTEPASGTNP